MFIASKFEEISPPTIEDFVFIADNTYSKEELCSMETFILATLSFSLNVVTPYTFIDTYINQGACNLRINMREFGEAFEHLAKYILELGVISHAYSKYPSSVFAVASVSLALYIMHSKVWLEEWNEDIEWDSVREIVVKLHALVVSRSFAALVEKYAQEKYYHVSTITVPPLVIE